MAPIHTWLVLRRSSDSIIITVFLPIPTLGGSFCVVWAVFASARLAPAAATTRVDDVSIVLMAVPGPPVFDAETQQQLQALVAKGAAGGLFFATDDVQGTYDELKDRGVEFQQEPTQQPYGVDAGFRDPSGNQMRVMQ